MHMPNPNKKHIIMPTSGILLFDRGLPIIIKNNLTIIEPINIGKAKANNILYSGFRYVETLLDNSSILFINPIYHDVKDWFFTSFFNQ